MGGEENWDVKPAQIYTTLARLEESGLVVKEAVEQGGGPEKRIYALTPAGRAELDTWFTTDVESAHQRDEFFVKLMLSLAVDGANPRKVIRTQRALLYQELRDVTAQRQQADPETELA